MVKGVNFSFPEKELKSVEYMGNGPYRAWKNRLKGSKFGVWKKTTTVRKQERTGSTRNSKVTTQTCIGANS